jgi:hypothetical protein
VSSSLQVHDPYPNPGDPRRSVRCQEVIPTDHLLLHILRDLSSRLSFDPVGSSFGWSDFQSRTFPLQHPSSSHNPSFLNPAKSYHLDSPSFPQTKHRKAEYTQLQLTSVRVRVLSSLQLSLCFFEEGSQGSRIGHVAKPFVRGFGVVRSTRREDGMSYVVQMNRFKE